MNIVYLVYNLVNSGPENVLYDICANLNREKYNPIIVALRRDTVGASIEEKFIALNIEIRKFNFSSWQMQFATSKVLKEVESSLEDVQDYIVHAHGFHPALIASKMKHKSVCTIHGISGDEFVMSHGRFIGNYMRWKLNMILNNIDYPVAISEYMKSYYQGHVSKKIVCIHNGVDSKPSKESKSILRKKLNIEEDKYVVIVVGVLNQRKNVSYLLGELKKSSDNDFLCLIIGNGPEMKNCKKIVADDMRFRFEGFKNNIADYQNVANLCVSSSLSEGLPLSVLEAINIGLPMLMSDIPPHKEISQAINLDSVKTFSILHNNLLFTFEEMKSLNFDRDMLQQRAKALFGARTMSEQYEILYEKSFA